MYLLGVKTIDLLFDLYLLAKIAWLFISGAAEHGNPWQDLFHIVHTHLLEGVDVPFGNYETGPTFFTYISWPK